MEKLEQKDNKHYTPSIEEFYVGLECEFFNNMTNRTWEPITCNTDDILIAFTSFEEGTPEWEDSIELTFRVKYLDSSDIESLGFKPSAWMEGTGVLDFYDDYDNKNLIITYYRDSVFGGDRLDIKKKGTIVFSGRVKNKSELIKVLKMIE